MTLIDNLTSIKFDILMSKMTHYGYVSEYVELALDKLLKYGILATDNGHYRKDLNEESKLETTSAIKEYLYKIIGETSYLQYACEDTPLPYELVVRIEDKYHVRMNSGHKEKRAKSVENLLEFINNEEKNEQAFLNVNSRSDKNSFLVDFGIQYEKERLSLYNYLKIKVKHNITFAKNP